MKKEVQRILKDKKVDHFYSDEKYELMKGVMKIAMKNDKWLKNYLSLDPLNKAEWIADHMIVRIKTKQP